MLPSLISERSAINLSNFGKLAKFDPGPFIYVRPVGGPKMIYVRPVGGPENTSNIGENPNINNLV